ncbi:MAG TPA: phosphoenolpyruvate--protein phosphotransferase [Candidatus Limnocylindria bacterium]|nr:phosphoenolpyruvate--protein phosphotransferase [Candidatus Limnocylindria bacterium]
MRRMHGVAAAPGIVHGPYIVLAPTEEPSEGQVAPDARPAELERLGRACEAAAAALDALAERVAADGHPDEGEIFKAQASIARDPALLSLAQGRIEAGPDDAIAAIMAAGRAFAEQLRSLDDELLAARAEDVMDVTRRIAAHLAGRGGPAPATLERPTIVVAQDLPPSVTATLPRDLLLGIALQGSSATAHAAILARAYGIPAVVGVDRLLSQLDSDGRGEALAIDGGTGDVVLDPDPSTLARFEAGSLAQRRRHESDVQEAALPARTVDRTEVALLANIGAPEEGQAALALGARGVGLFRTEFLFLERASAPSEDEQAVAYQQAIREFAPHPVTIRLLDVGGDKQIPYLPIEPEANPFLGVRALRIADSNPDLFVTQLRALYRASTAGPVKVMGPMVADGRDADLLLALAKRAQDELSADGRQIGEVSLGVMLEIPSSVLVADTFFDRIAFASLGTNDLAQYALAADRGNARLARYRDALHPAVLRLIRLAVEASRRAGIDLSVCGEMAGDPASALALTGLGLRSLSMAASSLPAVRRAIRGAALADLEAAAAAALDDPSAEDARARFDAMLGTAVGA